MAADELVPGDLLMAARLDDHLAEVGEARRRLLELVQGDLDLLQRGNLLDMIRLRCSNVDIVHRLLSVQRRNVE